MVCVAALAAVTLSFAPSAASGRARHHHRVRRPGHNAVIFVHGFEGSGAQFESQELRFTSNGYPGRYIAVLEYDSAEYANAIEGGTTLPQQEAPLFAQLDQLIAHMKAITHRRKVDLVAHSLGTYLMQDYLNSSKQRAANVAHYVNIDGRTASAPPGGVRTLAIWATNGPLSPPGASLEPRTSRSPTRPTCSPQ